MSLAVVGRGCCSWEGGDRARGLQPGEELPSWPRARVLPDWREIPRIRELVGGEVGQARESPEVEGVAPVCNPSGVRVLPEPPSPSIRG